MDKQSIKTLLNKSNPVIFEIGCNDGSDTQEFINVFENLIIYCFEPDARAYNKFTNNIKYEKCYLYNIAISSLDGEVDFYVSDSNQSIPGTPKIVGNNWDKSGSIKKPKYHTILHPWCKFNKTIKVKTSTLDSFVSQKNIDFIDFIWADVQGAEEDLIKGAINTLNNKVKYFYTEYNQQKLYDSDSSIQNITKLLPNFRLIKIFDNDLLLENKNC